MYRSSRLRCSSKWILWYFHKIHRKTSLLESLFDKVANFLPATLLKKRLWHSVFCDFFEIFRNIFYRTSSDECFLFTIVPVNGRFNFVFLIYLSFRGRILLRTLSFKMSKCCKHETLKFNPATSGVPKKSYIFKQTCSSKLSMYGLLVSTRR